MRGSITTVTIDPTRCDGHAVCESIAPDLFTVVDDVSVVRTTPADDDAVARAQEAAFRCPKQAIQLTEPGATDD